MILRIAVRLHHVLIHGITHITKPARATLIPAVDMDNLGGGFYLFSIPSKN